ncbi:hypothetical protein [Polycladidibacter stylochi]|uniref:hypothetical protein n=1 Tax=Polycladidibacter stylochi TaxID=1807766 RepID=UPI00083722CF|nr:hypothetical protein [Pseudovibrio stylochi]
MSSSFVLNSEITTRHKPQEMKLDQFLQEAGSEEINQIFKNVKTGSYSGCHCAFFEATGIWIPELVPVFQKMDAMASMGEEIKPAGL